MYERFTDRGRKVMQLANQEAQRFNHEYIGTEHILLALVLEGSGVAANVLKNLDIDLRKVRQEVEKIIQSGPEMMTMGKLPQTPRAKKVIEYAIEEARGLQHNYVGTEHLLLGLLREDKGVGAQVLMNLGLKLEEVRQEVLNLLGHNLTTEPGGGASGPLAAKLRLKTPALDGFGRDLTELAAQGKLDPVVGRGDEIERLFLILGRRTRNNPLLIGEPGVGKSALGRALAQRIAAEGQLRPTPYRRVVALDASWCAAAATDYAHCREAIVSIVEDVRKAKDILLVLDDFHRWEAFPYALAPLAAALTHGTIQCLAATSETSEPLPCFEAVRVEPLSRAATLPVLAALRSRYAEHHHVQIAGEAIQAIAGLSDAPGARRLPGMAVDVLDEACARVRLRAGPPPDLPSLTELDARIARLNREKEDAVFVQDFEKAAACFAEIDALKRERPDRARAGNVTVGVVDAAVVAEVLRLRGGSPR